MRVSSAASLTKPTRPTMSIVTVLGFPVASGTRPEIGAWRTRAASCPIRVQDDPGSALAHALARAHAASKAAGSDCAVLRYHGSRPLAGYVESSTTLRT